MALSLLHLCVPYFSSPSSASSSSSSMTEQDIDPHSMHPKTLAKCMKRETARIDAMLAKDSQERKENEPQMRVLLLGQAESGKSTTLKAFQLEYAPEQFYREAEYWTVVILLNLVQAVCVIMDMLSFHQSSSATSPSSPSSPRKRTKMPSSNEDYASMEGEMGGEVPLLSGDILWLCSRLRGSLESVEQSLKMRLAPESSTSSPPSSSSNSSSNIMSQRAMNASWAEDLIRVPPRRSSQNELAVRAIGSFSSTLSPRIPAYLPPLQTHSNNTPTSTNSSSSHTLPCSSYHTNPSGAPQSKEEMGQEFLKNWMIVVSRHSRDIVRLWGDEGVREVLRRWRLLEELKEGSGFFLDNAERIADMSYTPSAEDILRARLKTYGAAEHVIKVEKGVDKGRSWTLIDVGGPRRQRKIWAPYFDNVHGIIFLAPISTFNQLLEEDKNHYRLEDTMNLWQMICQNPLLADVHIILFFNKVDVLKKKLADGVQFRKYVPSYEGENNVQGVVQYMQRKFKSVHDECSVNKNRVLKTYVTSEFLALLGLFWRGSNDRTAMTTTLERVRQAIFVNMLGSAKLVV